MDQFNIMVIEDDDIVSRTIERCLRLDEFKVTVANTGVEGLKLARRHQPDLVILDVVMPGMDGYTVCREFRTDPLLSDIPIIFLTAKIKDEDKINALAAGADDYLCKPFNLDEIIFRVRAILRRSGKYRPESHNATPKIYSTQDVIQKGNVIQVSGYILNTKTYELTTPSNQKIRLTPVQYDLLYHLMTHPGEIFSPTRLLNEIWDYPSDAGSPDLVRVHIRNLRNRIEINPRAPSFIQTIPGYGYSVGLFS